MNSATKTKASGSRDTAGADESEPHAKSFWRLRGAPGGSNNKDKAVSWLAFLQLNGSPSIGQEEILYNLNEASLQAIEHQLFHSGNLSRIAGSCS